LIIMQQQVDDALVGLDDGFEVGHGGSLRVSGRRPGGRERAGPS